MQQICLTEAGCLPRLWTDDGRRGERLEECPYLKCSTPHIKFSHNITIVVKANGYVLYHFIQSAIPTIYQILTTVSLTTLPLSILGTELKKLVSEILENNTANICVKNLRKPPSMLPILRQFVFYNKLLNIKISMKRFGITVDSSANGFFYDDATFRICKLKKKRTAHHKLQTKLRIGSVRTIYGIKNRE